MTNLASSGAVVASTHSTDSESQIVLFGVKDDASCGCGDTDCPPKNRGKHPKCAPYEPGDNLGNLTGAKHGHIVVDVDVRSGDGNAELVALPGFTVPDTFTVETASGGAHFYFKHPGFDVGNGKLTPNIDVRGDARDEDGWAYVLAPGSRVVKPDGTVGTHEVADDLPLAPCPDWLLAALLARSTRTKPEAIVTPIDDTHPEWSQLVALGIEAAKSYAPSCGDGHASEALTRLAARLVIELRLPIPTAHEIIVEHFNPRCTTADGAPWPWSDDEIDRNLERRSREDDPMRHVPGFATLVKRLTDRGAKHERAISRLEAGREDAAPHEYECIFGQTATRTTEKATREELVNVLSGLDAAKWIDVLRYDVLRGGVSAHRPPIQLDAETSTFSEDDAERVAYWFACMAGKSASPDAILRVVSGIARKRPYNPLEEYFRALPPSTGAIDALCNVMGCKEDIERVYVRKFLLSAVRRALRPGCKADSILTLRGLPDMQKSSFVQALFGEEWTAESLPSLSNTKAVGEALASKWCVELAELAEMFRADRDTTTAFITRLSDRYRAAYARGSAQDHPRMCVLLATVNGHDIYSDVHEADVRRMWIVDVGGHVIDWRQVRALRDGVWSEAYAATAGDVWGSQSMLIEGEPHWLSEDEKKVHAERADGYRDVDPWQGVIARYLSGRKEVAVADVLSFALKIDIKEQSKRETNRAAKCLRGLKCIESRGVMRDGVKVNVWSVPETLSSAPPLIRTSSAHLLAKMSGGVSRKVSAA